MCFLRMLKIFRKKIVFTLHNKKPHNIEKDDYSVRLMRKMCKMSDAIVGMCEETYSVVEDLLPEAKNKVHIIPHPNYIYNYEGNNNYNYRDKYGFDDMPEVQHS